VLNINSVVCYRNTRWVQIKQNLVLQSTLWPFSYFLSLVTVTLWLQRCNLILKITWIQTNTLNLWRMCPSFKSQISWKLSNGKTWVGHEQEERKFRNFTFAAYCPDQHKIHVNPYIYTIKVDTIETISIKIRPTIPSQRAHLPVLGVWRKGCRPSTKNSTFSPSPSVYLASPFLKHSPIKFPLPWCPRQSNILDCQSSILRRQ